MRKLFFVVLSHRFLNFFQVQNKAAEAKETAVRARQEILNSMETLKKLKERLENVGSNDVQSTLQRILDAKGKAEEAKDSAVAARNRAVDLLRLVNNIKIPNLSEELAKLGLTREDNSEQDGEQLAKKIEDQAEKLKHQLDVLFNELSSSKRRLESRYARASPKK